MTGEGLGTLNLTMYYGWTRSAQLVRF